MASEKITAIVESVKTMTVLELKELVDTICEEFGVSAVAAAAPAAAARILCKFADADKSKRFVVKGGFCDGVVMDAAGVKSLSTMPNREGLLSMLAGSLNGIIGGLAVAIQGIVDKQEETPAA